MRGSRIGDWGLAEANPTSNPHSEIRNQQSLGVACPRCFDFQICDCQFTTGMVAISLDANRT